MHPALEKSLPENLEYGNKESSARATDRVSLVLAEGKNREDSHSRCTSIAVFARFRGREIAQA